MKLTVLKSKTSYVLKQTPIKALVTTLIEEIVTDVDKIFLLSLNNCQNFLVLGNFTKLSRVGVKGVDVESCTHVFINRG